MHKVTSFCYNGPRVRLDYAPVLQNTVLFCNSVWKQR